LEDYNIEIMGSMFNLKSFKAKISKATKILVPTLITDKSASYIQGICQNLALCAAIAGAISSQGRASQGHLFLWRRMQHLSLTEERE